jgi:hypothetical protein
LKNQIESFSNLSTSFNIDQGGFNTWGETIEDCWLKWKKKTTKQESFSSEGIIEEFLDRIWDLRKGVKDEKKASELIFKHRYEFKFHGWNFIRRGECEPDPKL